MTDLPLGETPKPPPQAPRLIVEVRSEPRLGDKAILAPGTALSVGRTERAGLAIETDAQLSGVHFELAWDGARRKLRERGIK